MYDLYNPIFYEIGSVHEPQIKYNTAKDAPSNILTEFKDVFADIANALIFNYNFTDR